MILFYVCVLPVVIAGYCSEKSAVLFSGMLLAGILDKKALLQLSPSHPSTGSGGQGIGFAYRALIMAMHKKQINIAAAERAFTSMSYLLNSKPSQLPASINQAIPKCTIKPPQILCVL